MLCIIINQYVKNTCLHLLGSLQGMSRYFPTVTTCRCRCLVWGSGWRTHALTPARSLSPSLAFVCVASLLFGAPRRRAVDLTPSAARRCSSPPQEHLGLCGCCRRSTGTSFRHTQNHRRISVPSNSDSYDFFLCFLFFYFIFFKSNSVWRRTPAQKMRPLVLLAAAVCLSAAAAAGADRSCSDLRQFYAGKGFTLAGVPQTEISGEFWGGEMTTNSDTRFT